MVPTAEMCIRDSVMGQRQQLFAIQYPARVLRQRQQQACLLYTSYSANGNLGVGYELDAIAAVILGGTSFVGGIGTITGTLVGALIIATLNNGMTLMGVSYFWQLVIKGAVIIIAVLIDKYRTRHHQSA